MLASRCRRLPGKCRLWCPAGWRLPTEASGNVAAWLRRMASMAELFLFIRCGDRDAGGLHRELHLPRLGYVRRSTSCSSSWCAALLVVPGSSWSFCSWALLWMAWCCWLLRGDVLPRHGVLCLLWLGVQWWRAVSCLAFTATRSTWLFLLALGFKVIAGIAWSFCVSE